MNWRLIWNKLRARALWPYWALRAWRFQFEPDCGHVCDWVYPYGFVPEDGCPVHDRYNWEETEGEMTEQHIPTRGEKMLDDLWGPEARSLAFEQKQNILNMLNAHLSQAERAGAEAVMAAEGQVHRVQLMVVLAVALLVVFVSAIGAVIYGKSAYNTQRVEVVQEPFFREGAPDLAAQFVAIEDPLTDPRTADVVIEVMGLVSEKDTSTYVQYSDVAFIEIQHADGPGGRASYTRTVVVVRWDFDKGAWKVVSSECQVQVGAPPTACDKK